jgi:hypothetical protein
VVVVALARSDSPVRTAFGAVLELGARWRGRWRSDTSDPAGIDRLHVAGMIGACHVQHGGFSAAAGC